MREQNVTTHCLENQEHGTSSSHIEPTNGAAPPSQPSHGAYASQHGQKIPVSDCKYIFIFVSLI